MAEDRYFEQIARLNRVFTPATPVQLRNLLAGRRNELQACLDTCLQQGAHCILYGERGVGKTSVANIVTLVLRDIGSTQVVKCSCTSEETFETLWQKVFWELTISRERVSQDMGFGVKPKINSERIVLGDIFNGNKYTATSVLRVLRVLTDDIIIILDEFDRMNPSFDLRTFADMVKNVSDAIPKVTFIIVGIGETVSDLIGEHESIVRNLKQIHLPTMSPQELLEIIEKGMQELDMEMTDEVKHRIVEYSYGYPHYTHLLSMNACKTALQEQQTVVTNHHFDQSVQRSINETHESLRHAYHRATIATRKNIYKEVLWACSMSPIDEYSTFQARDLEIPLSRLLGKTMKTHQFGGHLNRLSSEERGNILTCLGTQQRHRYKFTNPLMRAYIKLNMHVNHSTS